MIDDTFLISIYALFDGKYVLFINMENIDYFLSNNAIFGCVAFVFSAYFLYRLK